MIDHGIHGLVRPSTLLAVHSSPALGDWRFLEAKETD
jgi:hypothetical protein